ncbi:FtsX-like permease family protein [Robinsoniella sp. KNHs210]|uniref:FtsX-like permease family protein n=1 Tax=Robinsoniella sp. KNHs210 TaxID=1469950 RepID=UPI0005C7E7B1|nr:ABC transporter permease [Robinsoniella sp. KNHs210]
MNIILIAIKNLKKNFSFYTLYLISASLVITIFFAFTSFSMNDVMLEKISSDGRVEMMCRTVSVFLMAFVVFYMTYSNGFFLRRRTRELGIYALLGYRKSAIMRLLALENFFICTASLIIGVLAGGFLHKGVVAFITALLNLSLSDEKMILFNPGAIVQTAIFVLAVISAMFLSNGKVIRQTSLLNLIRLEKHAEKNMKTRIVPSILGLLMILSGYFLALNILQGKDSLWITAGFTPIGMLTLLLVTFGTIFFINSFLPCFMSLTRRSKRFYTEVRIITIPNFIYRIRSNARTIIMLTLFSAATLTITGVMALTLYYPIAAVSRIAPSEIEFRVENTEQIPAVKHILAESQSLESNQTLATNYSLESNHSLLDNMDSSGVTHTLTDIIKVTSDASVLPIEYQIGSAKGDANNEKLTRVPGFECISASSYEQLMTAQGRSDSLEGLLPLTETQCILVKYEPNADGSDETGCVYPLLTDKGPLNLKVKSTTLANPISFANSIGTLIISDEAYNRLVKMTYPRTTVLSLNGPGLKNNESIYTAMEKITDNSPYLQGNSHRIQELLTLNSSTFLLIGFLVVLFFIATGSILYFNNVSAITDSREDLDILKKMGYSSKKIKIIIRNQVFTFFSIPFIIGLTDSLFALLVYKRGLMQNLLGDTLIQYLPVAVSVGVTAAIYLIYYMITKRTCYKIIFSSSVHHAPQSPN